MLSFRAVAVVLRGPYLEGQKRSPRTDGGVAAFPVLPILEHGGWRDSGATCVAVDRNVASGHRCSARLEDERLADLGRRSAEKERLAADAAEKAASGGARSKGAPSVIVSAWR